MLTQKATGTAMIVDDHHAARFIVRTILEFFGYNEILEFDNGEEAYETHLRKGASIIIADFKMPGLDGVSLVRKIRWECTGDHQRVPFILLSAALDKDTVFQARDAGASALLSKPIQARMVCERVLQVMRDEREFVIVDEYIGPDRRVRSADHLYDGEDRRAGKDGEGAEGGETGSDNVSDDDIDAMLAQ